MACHINPFLSVDVNNNDQQMAWLTRLSWLLGSKDIEANIAIVGLTGSGKTTIMRQLKPHEVSQVM